MVAKGGGGSLNASVQLSDLPVQPLASLMNLGKAQGTIGLDLTADIGPSHAQAQFTLNGNKLEFGSAQKKATPADIVVKANWNGQMLDLDGHISGLDTKAATLTAHIPVVKAQGSYMPKLAQSGAVSAQFSARMQVQRMIALLPLAEQTASGMLMADVHVSGDVSNPQFSGSMAMNKGSFTDFQTGTRLTNLDFKLAAEGGAKATLTLSANDANSGTVKGQGEFSMAALESGGAGKLAGHLDLTFDNFAAVREDLVHGALSGKLAMDFPGDQPPKITGKLRTNTVRVDVGAAIPASVPTIEVREINGGPPLNVQKQAKKAASKPSLFSKTTLGISIDIPNRLFVTGHGIDAEWSGNLAVNGTVGSPDISGKLELVRGTIELVGKTFDIQTGEVRIANSIPGHASVHVVAQNASSDLTVTVTVDGAVTDPKITWSSSPALPQSEILSHLFFGAGTPSLSVGQAFQLAQLSGQLNSIGLGGSGGGGILSFARNLTGLDVLKFSAPSDLSGTGAAVTAGKYINDRVYLGVTQGKDLSAGSAEVRVKITPHITVNATAGANSHESVGVNWKWDY